MTGTMLLIMLLGTAWLLAVGAVLVLCRGAQRGDLALRDEDARFTPAPVVSISVARRAQLARQLADAPRRSQAR